MKVILKKDYQNLGEEGDVVEVKTGFARNYLIPQDIALVDSPDARAYFKGKAKAIAKRKEEKKELSKSLKERLAGLDVKFVMATGDNDKLFASVTPLVIQDKLKKDFDIDVDRKKISVDSKSIKTPGNYSCVISLYQGDTVTVKFTIEAEPKPVKLTEKELRKPRRAKAEETAEAEGEATPSAPEATPANEN